MQLTIAWIVTVYISRSISRVLCCMAHLSGNVVHFRNERASFWRLTQPLGHDFRNNIWAAYPILSAKTLLT